jgi:hypothetical protein
VWTALTSVLAASVALVWFTIHTPERGKNPLVTMMEKDSALFFATERDITALAHDAKTGAAKSIGLSMEYALVSLNDGGHYYVRIDTQRNLIMELLKDNLSPAAPAVFSLSQIQPPAPPLTALSYQADTAGFQAAELLIAHLEGTLEEPRQILLPFELIVRGTTGPAREA